MGQTQWNMAFITEFQTRSPLTLFPSHSCWRSQKACYFVHQGQVMAKAFAPSLRKEFIWIENPRDETTFGLSIATEKRPCMQLSLANWTLRKWKRFKVFANGTWLEQRAIEASTTFVQDTQQRCQHKMKIRSTKSALIRALSVMNYESNFHILEHSLEFRWGPKANQAHWRRTTKMKCFRFSHSILLLQFALAYSELWKLKPKHITINPRPRRSQNKR